MALTASSMASCWGVVASWPPLRSSDAGVEGGTSAAAWEPSLDGAKGGTTIAIRGASIGYLGFPCEVLAYWSQLLGHRVCSVRYWKRPGSKVF